MFYEKTVLENGVTVLTERMSGVRSASLGFWVHVGSRDEASNQAGMSHLMEHMLFKGTPTRDAFEISRSFDALGAELNAFTAKEHTCFHARMMDKHFAACFEVLADMVANACFPESTIAPEREVVIEEIASNEDTPDDLVFDLFGKALWPNHPLGRPILGSAEVVGKVTAQDLHAYHQQHYVTGNLMVVACGNVQHEQVVELARKHLAGMRQGPRNERPLFTEESPNGLLTITKSTEQAHVVLGWPGVSFTDKRRFALSILEMLLGGGMSSRLFTEIREKRGLVYSVYTMSQFFADAGHLIMYAGTRPENVAEVLQVTRNEVAKLLEQGIEREEFDRARELLCGNLVLAMESTRMHMHRLGKMAVDGRPIPSLDETLEEYGRVTVEDVMEVARQILGQRPSLAVISPFDNSQIEEMI